MPWKSLAQREKLKDTFTEAQLKEWDDATDFSTLPERVAKLPGEAKGSKRRGFARFSRPRKF